MTPEPAAIRKFALAAGLGLTLALAPTASAATTTLGVTSQPSLSTPDGCNGVDVEGQYTDDQYTDEPSTPYEVRDRASAITQWKIDTIGATPGKSVTFLVLRSFDSTSYSVVAQNTETIPNPLPVGGLATFNLQTPIVVQPGDTLGIYGQSGSAVCDFHGGSTPTADTTFNSQQSGVPFAEGTIDRDGTSPPGYLANLAATLDTTPPADASVTAAQGPFDASVGDNLDLWSQVANAGPVSARIRFSDVVPHGLKLISATEGSGFCGTYHQWVNCVVPSLPPGQTTPIVIRVVPRATGTYSNTTPVAVAPPEVDPNPANNRATTKIRVRRTRGPSSRCTVPPLKRTTAGVAERLLRLLGCKVKVRRQPSRAIARGLVISTTPGTGTRPAGTRVVLKVSKGP